MLVLMDLSCYINMNHFQFRSGLTVIEYHAVRWILINITIFLQISELEYYRFSLKTRHIFKSCKIYSKSERFRS